MNKATDKHFQSYMKIKQSLNLPLKVKVFLWVLQQTVNKIKHSQVSKQLHKKYHQIVTIFKKRTYEEKVMFLYEHVKLFKTLIQQKDQNSSSSQGMDNIKEIQTSCKIKQAFVGFTIWQKKCFSLNKRTMRVKIGSKKQNVYNLHYYYVRHSQKYSKTLILESISPEVPKQQNQVYIYFENEILYQEIYSNIFSCIVQSSVKQLISFLNDKQDNQQQITTGCQTMTKATTILDTKSLNNYFRQKDKKIRKLNGPNNRFEEVEMNLPQIKISIDKKKSNRYKFERIFDQPLQNLLEKIRLIKRKPDQVLLQFQNLQKFSTNIFVGYFKFIFNKNVYQFLTIVEENRKLNQYTLILKGIDNFISQQYIEFLYLRIKQVGKKSKLTFIAIVNNKLKKKLNIDFLITLIDTSNNKEQILQSQQFWTVRSNNDQMQQDQQQISIEQANRDGLILMNKKLSKSDVISQAKVYCQRFILQPTLQPLKNHDRMQQHFLFNQWKIAKNGGVICTNQVVVKEQKRVFKLILARMGNNILKQKSIINFSLPVTVFRKQSHLKTIARNFSYAPILFQNYKNMSLIQRMKKAIILQISLNNLGISMNKPFNPILGQTYQATIDGCPIFLQQISHHPPISSYYMVCRGFKLHGIIQSKASLGLNCIKGFSPHLNYIQFDDGIKYEYNISVMVINALLFGDRTFNYQGQNFIIDKKNKIGTKLVYGPSSQSFFKKSTLPYDAVTGNIIKVQEWTNDKIQSLNKGQKLSSIQGLWHSQIKIDNKKVIDFRVDLPPNIRDIQQPLQSDSKFRIDLKKLIDGNIQDSQQQKDFMQQIQRRDRRLRETYFQQRKK